MTSAAAPIAAPFSHMGRSASETVSDSSRTRVLKVIMNVRRASISSAKALARTIRNGALRMSRPTAPRASNCACEPRPNQLPNTVLPTGVKATVSEIVIGSERTMAAKVLNRRESTRDFRNDRQRTVVTSDAAVIRKVEREGGIEGGKRGAWTIGPRQECMDDRFRHHVQLDHQHERAEEPVTVAQPEQRPFDILDWLLVAHRSSG